MYISSFIFSVFHIKSTSYFITFATIMPAMHEIFFVSLREFLKFVTFFSVLKKNAPISGRTFLDCVDNHVHSFGAEGHYKD